MQNTYENIPPERRDEYLAHAEAAFNEASEPVLRALGHAAALDAEVISNAETITPDDVVEGAESLLKNPLVVGDEAITELPEQASPEDVQESVDLFKKLNEKPDQTEEQKDAMDKLAEDWRLFQTSEEYRQAWDIFHENFIRDHDKEASIGIMKELNNSGPTAETYRAIAGQMGSSNEREALRQLDNQPPRE